MVQPTPQVTPASPKRTRIKKSKTTSSETASNSNIQADVSRASTAKASKTPDILPSAPRTTPKAGARKAAQSIPEDVAATTKKATGEPKKSRIIQEVEERGTLKPISASSPTSISPTRTTATTPPPPPTKRITTIPLPSAPKTLSKDPPRNAPVRTPLATPAPAHPYRTPLQKAQERQELKLKLSKAEMDEMIATGKVHPKYKPRAKRVRNIVLCLPIALVGGWELWRRWDSTIRLKFEERVPAKVAVEQVPNSESSS